MCKGVGGGGVGMMCGVGHVWVDSDGETEMEGTAQTEGLANGRVPKQIAPGAATLPNSLGNLNNSSVFSGSRLIWVFFHSLTHSLSLALFQTLALEPRHAHI